MYFGRVVGCVWCTVKDASMTGRRMLGVQPLTLELRKTGKQLICTDSTGAGAGELDRKSTRLHSSHLGISYAVFCLKKKNTQNRTADKIAEDEAHLQFYSPL